MEKTRIELLKEEETNIIEACDAYNKAFKANDATAMAKADETLREAEANYAKQQAYINYDRINGMDAPMYELIKEYGYAVLVHKDVREQGRFVKRETTMKGKQYDLEDFCAYADIDRKWAYTVQALGHRLTLRVATDLGMSKAEIREIDDSYKMDSLAREVDLGKTPTSNTQLVAELQRVIDAILFVDDGSASGKNALKAIAADVKFLREAFTAKGKGKHQIKVLKNKALVALVADIMNRIITNGRYSLAYPTKASKVQTEATAPAAEPEKVSAEAEKVSTEYEAVNSEMSESMNTNGGVA